MGKVTFQQGFCFKAWIFLLLFFAPMCWADFEGNHFVSTVQSTVNMRVGPGRTYPIVWVYKSLHYPFEVLSRFENWVKVKDYEGNEGWIFSKMLSSRRNVIINRPQVDLKKGPEKTSPSIAHLKEGIMASLRECTKGWCKISVHKHKNIEGWVPEYSLWGLQSKERENN